MRIGVDQRQQVERFVLLEQLRAHLERDQPREAVAAEPVGAMRLHAADLLDVMARHRFDARQRQHVAVDARGPQAVDRDGRTQALDELSVAEHLAPGPADEEQRPVAVAGTHRHDRGPASARAGRD